MQPAFFTDFMKRYLALLFLFSNILGFFSSAQQFNLRNYTIEDGLPQSQVMGIVQDKKGYLWIATNGGGVARFDGKKFAVFTTKEGLPDNRVNFVFLDKKGLIWFATQNGIASYDGKVFISYGEKQGLKAAKILSIGEDDNENLWLGSEKEGLWKFDGKNFSIISLPNYKNKDDQLIIHSIIGDNDGSVWIGTNNALFYYHNDKFTYYSSENSKICGNDVWALCQDHNKNIWSGTWNKGICCLEHSEFKTFGPECGITNMLITSLFEDDEHNLWIGSDGGGIYRMNISQKGLEKVSYNINETTGL